MVSSWLVDLNRATLKRPISSVLPTCGPTQASRLKLPILTTRITAASLGTQAKSTIFSASSRGRSKTTTARFRLICLLTSTSISPISAADNLRPILKPVRMQSVRNSAVVVFTPGNCRRKTASKRWSAVCIRALRLVISAPFPIAWSELTKPKQFRLGWPRGFEPPSPAPQAGALTD